MLLEYKKNHSTRFTDWEKIQFWKYWSTCKKNRTEEEEEEEDHDEKMKKCDFGPRIHAACLGMGVWVAY